MIARLGKLCEAAMLRDLINQGLVMRLYVNDHQPKRADSAEDYTEAQGGGYAPKLLTPGLWRIVERDDGLVAEFPELQWEFTGRVGDVHGYYVVAKSGEYRWAFRFVDESGTPTTYPIRVAGDRIRVSVSASLGI